MGKHGEKKFLKILMYQLTVFSNLMSCLSSFTFLLKRRLLFFRLLLVLLFSTHFVQPLTGVDVTHVELQTAVAWVVVVKFVVTVGFTCSGDGEPGEIAILEKVGKESSWIVSVDLGPGVSTWQTLGDSVWSWSDMYRGSGGDRSADDGVATDCCDKEAVFCRLLAGCTVCSFNCKPRFS